MVSMSTSRTCTSASSRWSACQLAATATGARSPITTRAGRTPSSSTTSGVRETPGRDPEREDRLEGGEHARQDGLVGQASEQGEATDVDQSVADTDETEQRIAVAWSGRTPITASGAPNSATPTPNQGASLPPRPAPRRGSTEMPPAPIAAVRTPTPGSPAPSRSMATTTTKTVRQPRRTSEPCPAPRSEQARDRPRWWRTPGASRDRRRPQRALAAGRHTQAEHQQAGQQRCAAQAAKTAAGPLIASSKPRQPGRRAWRPSPACRGPHSRSSAVEETRTTQAAAPSAPAGKAPARPWRRSPGHTSHGGPPAAATTAAPPRVAALTRPTQARTARGAPGRPRSQATVPARRRSHARPGDDPSAPRHRRGTPARRARPRRRSRSPRSHRRDVRAGSTSPARHPPASVSRRAASRDVAGMAQLFHADGRARFRASRNAVGSPQRRNRIRRQRREWDSNPQRPPRRGLAVFKTAPFGRSGIPPTGVQC